MAQHHVTDPRFDEDEPVDLDDVHELEIEGEIAIPRPTID